MLRSEIIGRHSRSAETEWPALDPLSSHGSSKNCWRGSSSAVLVLLVLASMYLGGPLGGPVAAYGSGDANQAVCANEVLPTFRTYLPDCRAYELASSPYKSGKPVGIYVAPDGSRVLEVTLGAHAGTESNLENGAVYELGRTSLGWQSSSISPSVNVLPGQVFAGASTDLSSTLWLGRTPEESIEALDLYRRGTAGQLNLVGPLNPPSARGGPPGGEKGILGQADVYPVLATSGDLEHVLFGINQHGTHWPGDATTGQVSLYELEGLDNSQPRLVGVEAQGHLISQCETTLGSEASGDTFNALSARGNVAFFTAVGHSQPGGACEPSVPAPEVSELYARLDHIESVAISEPSPAQCSACDFAIEKSASEGGARQPAEFAGASRDGSRVFFLTSQELFEGDNGTGLYEYDFNASAGRHLIRASRGSSTPQVLGVARISQDGSHAYFVAGGALTEEANAQGVLPVDGQPNLYIFERDEAFPSGTLRFIATLSPEDAADWTAADERPVQTTPDGRFLVFQSITSLTPGAAGENEKVYEYDSSTGRLVRVSVGQTGYPAGAENANNSVAFIPALGFSKGHPLEAVGSVMLSSDGHTVIFNSTGALTPQAEHAASALATSVYEYHSGKTIEEGDVYLLSTGDTTSIFTVDIDESAQNVFMLGVPSPTFGEGRDSVYDLFDARVDGGIASGGSSGACAGGGCPEAASLPLSLPPLASGLTNGEAAVSGGGQVTTISAAAAHARARAAAAHARARAHALKRCQRLHGRRRRRCRARAKRMSVQGSRLAVR